jgi:hypothetical protein
MAHKAILMTIVCAAFCWALAADAQDIANPSGRMPNKDIFTLADLGYGDIVIEGIGAAPPVHFDTAAGIRLIGPNQLLRVQYSHGPLQQKDLLALEIRFNGHILGNFPLFKVHGEPGRRQDLQLPVAYFSTENRLNFSVVPNGQFKPKPINYENIANKLTIYRDTTVYVDAEHGFDAPGAAFAMPLNRYLSIWMSERPWSAPLFILLLGSSLWMFLRKSVERKKEQFVLEMKGSPKL